jgi:hypothetical protein
VAADASSKDLTRRALEQVQLEARKATDKLQGDLAEISAAIEQESQWVDISPSQRAIARLAQGLVHAQLMAIDAVTGVLELRFRLEDLEEARRTQLLLAGEQGESLAELRDARMKHEENYRMLLVEIRNVAAAAGATRSMLPFLDQPPTGAKE